MTAIVRHSRSPFRLIACVCALVLSACSSGDSGVPDEELGGLVVAATGGDRAIDMERLRHHSDELVRAAQMPHARVGELISSHRYRGKVHLQVHEGAADSAEPVEDLKLETTIELAADGSYRARSENSKEYGREVVYSDGWLYLAPRYSKFHKRAPESGTEPADIRSAMFSELGAHLELIAAGFDVEDQGSGESSAGESTADESADTARAVRKLAIAKAESPRKNSPETRKHRAWRASIDVTEASGELAVDTQTGVVLHGRVHGALTFQRDGREFTMTFDVEHDIVDIGADIAIAAPADDRWVATPLRRREVEERDRLLEGIAPPTPKKKSNQSAAEGGASGSNGAPRGESK